jgi:deoxyribodipyrimidine photolyase
MHCNLQVATAVGAWYILLNRRYEPAASAADRAVEDALAAQGFQVQTYAGHLLR